MRFFITAFITAACASAAPAQTARDAGSVARDLAAPNARGDERASEITAPPVAAPLEQGIAFNGVMIGAVRVDGVPALPREAFTPAIVDFLGKQATTQDLQVLAKAVASVARERGYVFATAVVPPQTLEAGMVTVRVDEGIIAAVRVKGSASARLQRTLNLIVGRGVQRDLLERQLLLAGDIPGIDVLTTKMVHEDIGNVLIVEVRESRADGFAGLDNFGASDLGPVRARLRLELPGLVDDGNDFSMQAVVTPADPRQLAYLSARYAASLGIGGTQVAVTGALGRAKAAGTDFESRSTYVGISASTPLRRANGTSIWANTEVGVLRVMGEYRGLPDQRDSMAVASAWLYGTTRLTGSGRLSGSIGLSRGLAFGGTTVTADPRASRIDASGEFLKGYFWTDWIQPLRHGFTLKLAASGQLADRPLLAAQEVGLGGPTFGRAYDFSERFGDSGFMASGEVRWRRGKPLAGVDWVEPYAFLDAGRVWNLRGGFGSGDLASAGGGVRASVGKLQLTVEAAAPVDVKGSSTRKTSPRINMSAGLRF